MRYRPHREALSSVSRRGWTDRVRKRGFDMARPHLAAGTRGALAGRQGRTLILIALAVLAVAGGAALALGVTTKTKPLNTAITAERVELTVRVPVVSRVELTDCDPLEPDELMASTPSR